MITLYLHTPNLDFPKCIHKHADLHHLQLCPFTYALRLLSRLLQRVSKAWRWLGWSCRPSKYDGEASISKRSTPFRPFPPLFSSPSPQPDRMTFWWTSNCTNTRVPEKQSQPWQTSGAVKAIMRYHRLWWQFADKIVKMWMDQVCHSLQRKVTVCELICKVPKSFYSVLMSSSWELLSLQTFWMFKFITWESLVSVQPSVLYVILTLICQPLDNFGSLQLYHWFNEYLLGATAHVT